MNITPTPVTAALAGVFSALVLPLLRTWFGGDTGLSLPFLFALILTVAAPAHALVIGFRNGLTESPSPRTLDTALLKRIGAWIAAAAVVTLLRLAL